MPHVRISFCSVCLFVVVSHSGGPVIDMKYGRKDAVAPEDCVDEGNLPAGNKPFPDADNAQVPSLIVVVAAAAAAAAAAMLLGRAPALSTLFLVLS